MGFKWLTLLIVPQEMTKATKHTNDQIFDPIFQYFSHWKRKSNWFIDSCVETFFSTWLKIYTHIKKYLHEQLWDFPWMNERVL